MSGTAFRDASGNIIVAYTGTNTDSGFGETARDGVTDEKIGVAPGSINYKPAYDFYEQVQKKQGQEPVVTGHSLGGTIAQRVALHYNTSEAVTYNAAPLDFSWTLEELYLVLVMIYGPMAPIKYAKLKADYLKYHNEIDKGKRSTQAIVPTTVRQKIGYLVT